MTKMYLPFTIYQKIIWWNADSKPELSYLNFIKYVDFCIDHGFEWFGMESGLSLGVLYYRLKEQIG